MEYFEAPRPIHTKLPSVFLAGGITDCPDWQSEATTDLARLDVAVINPRRQDFPIGDPSAAEQQIRWEFYALSAASLILFWFPDSGSTTQPIALYELGRYPALGRRFVVGRDPRYVRRQDIDIQIGLAFRNMRIYETLTETTKAAAAVLENL